MTIAGCSFLPALQMADSSADTADFACSGEANYKQLVRPYLPILLGGRPPRECRVVEIGCGIGRMTEWFARDFGFVEAVDVSPVMIEQARRRLRDHANLAFHVGSGADLARIAEGSADLVFSYIVFQHIPSREPIESYVREAARVLKENGAFKFQLNGDQSPAYARHPRDTWLGEVFRKWTFRPCSRAPGFHRLPPRARAPSIMSSRQSRESRRGSVPTYGPERAGPIRCCSNVSGRP